MPNALKFNFLALAFTINVFNFFSVSAMSNDGWERRLEKAKDELSKSVDAYADRIKKGGPYRGGELEILSLKKSHWSGEINLCENVLAGRRLSGLK